jgi:hypothetical protein
MQRGIMPSKLFAEPHPSRAPCVFGKYPPREFVMNAQVLAFKKQIVLCGEGWLCDFVGDGMIPRNVQAGRYNRLVGASRSLDLVVLASEGRRDYFIYRLGTGLTTCLRSRECRKTCAVVIGGAFLLVGGSDCSVTVFGLTNANRISRSAFHRNPVISVGGSLDLGVVVSVDTEGVVIFETLSDHKLINVILVGAVTVAPIICVFKSGLVAISGAADVQIYDCRGYLLTTLELCGPVISIEKYYDIGSREVLFVSYEADFIALYDLTTFERLETIRAPFTRPIVSPLKRRRAFLVAGHGRKVHLLHFSDMLTSVFGRTDYQNCLECG